MTAFVEHVIFWTIDQSRNKHSIVNQYNMQINRFIEKKWRLCVCVVMVIIFKNMLQLIPSFISFPSGTWVYMDYMVPVVPGMATISYRSVKTLAPVAASLSLS